MLRNMSRRKLLERLGQVGGPAAAYEGMSALGLLPVSAKAAPLSLPPDAARGQSVAILGAGVGGLCAAYELDRAGYAVTVLESSERAGGRSLTLRRGDSFREMGDGPTQTCAFDAGAWLNAGPGRIPHHHTHVLDYCRRLNVVLQPYIFHSRSNYIHSATLGNEGGRIPARRVAYNLQGHVAELLDKCVSNGSLNEPLNGVDVKRLHEMLVKFGDLSPVSKDDASVEWKFRNQQGRAGYEVEPGLAAEPGVPLSPMSLDVLLRSDVWDDWVFRDARYAWQATLMEPVGGMDMFWRGFMRQPLRRGSGTVADLVRYNARVTGIETSADKVTVAFTDAGAAATRTFDHCISTIPMTIFAGLKTNLDGRIMKAAASLPLVPSGKVGWQAERFWETEDNIYGGISWESGGLEQMWYPSEGFLSAKGILTGVYVRGANAVAFNAKTVQERLQAARELAERLHPGQSGKLEHGVAIAWDRMEHLRQGWSDHDHPDWKADATVLSAPQGRFYQGGCQLTSWAGWQEGAVLAAQEAIRTIDRQTRPGAN